MSIPRHADFVPLCGPLLLLFCSAASAADEEQQQPEPAEPLPDKYILDYPAAERFCPPIRSTFFEAERTQSTVKGRTFRHQANGGYGLPVIDQVDGQNLLHVGADLGWYQVGEPVFAVAAGVVRISLGPDFQDERPRAANDGAALAWGNLVVIEHRLPDDSYATTVYGHLATKRLVKMGDVVAAGQQIGEIGRQHFRINGGYKPHLHFGVREGRQAEIGGAIVSMNYSGGRGDMTLLTLGEESIEVGLPEGIRTPLNLRIGGHDFLIDERDGKFMAPANMLWLARRPDFSLSGYALATDGWRDPVRFLRAQRADVYPAPFRLGERGSRRGR